MNSAVQSAAAVRFSLPDNTFGVQLPITASWGLGSVFSSITFEPEAAVTITENFRLDMNTALQLRVGAFALGIAASLSGTAGGKNLVAVPAGISIFVVGLHIDHKLPGISLGLAY